MRLERILVIAMLSMTCSMAFAGNYAPQAVDVDPVAMFAGGDLWSGRTDDNDDVYIGCGVRRFSDGAGGVTFFSFCQAVDAEGDMAFCNSSDPALVEAIDGISDFSYLTFSWEIDDFGNAICNRIGHSTQSFYLPLFRLRR